MPTSSLQGESLTGVAQAKEYEKTQTAAEERTRANTDAVFELACRFIVMKSLPGWMEEICTENLQAARPGSALNKELKCISDRLSHAPEVMS